MVSILIYTRVCWGLAGSEILNKFLPGRVLTQMSSLQSSILTTWPLPFGAVFLLQLVLLSYHPVLKLVSFLGANRTKSASVGPRLLRGAIEILEYNTIQNTKLSGMILVIMAVKEVHVDRLWQLETYQRFCWAEKLKFKRIWHNSEIQSHHFLFLSFLCKIIFLEIYSFQDLELLGYTLNCFNPLLPVKNIQTTVI